MQETRPAQGVRAAQRRMHGGDVFDAVRGLDALYQGCRGARGLAPESGGPEVRLRVVWHWWAALFAEHVVKQQPRETLACERAVVALPEQEEPQEAFVYGFTGDCRVLFAQKSSPFTWVSLIVTSAE